MYTTAVSCCAASPDQRKQSVDALRPKRSRWLVEDEVDGEIENALANSINWRFATPTSSTRTSTSTLHPTRSSS